MSLSQGRVGGRGAYRDAGGSFARFGGDLIRAHGCSVSRVIKVLRLDFKTGSEFHRAVRLTSIWVLKGNV